MTTLTIGSSVGSDIVVTSDGSTVYEIEAWDPKPLPIENAMSLSATADGGDLSGSVRRPGSCLLTVRCSGADLDEAWVNAAALQAVVEVDDGTGWNGEPDVWITEDLTSRTRVYHDCIRAAADIIRDPVLMDGAAAFRIQVSLPCVSRSWEQDPLPEPPP